MSMDGSGLISGFIARYDSDGGVLHARVFPDDFVEPLAVAVDREGRAVVAGVLSASQGSFVAMFDAEGTTLWSQDFDSPELPVIIPDVAVDPFGNVLIAGYDEGAFVDKLRPAGNFLWGRGLPGTGTEAHGVGTDGAGNPFVAGHFRETISFGDGLVTPRGSDIFVVALEP
jgi:hypothetical protein